MKRADTCRRRLLAACTVALLLPACGVALLIRVIPKPWPLPAAALLGDGDHDAVCTADGVILGLRNGDALHRTGHQRNGISQEIACAVALGIQHIVCEAALNRHILAVGVRLREAEREAEFTQERYSSKDALKAMREAIGGEQVV